MGGSDVIGNDGHDGHEGGTPLSCWVERSKPRYKGPSSLIFHNVFWYWFEGTKMVSDRSKQGRLEAHFGLIGNMQQHM